MMDVVGTCSICGGEVMSYRIWHAITPPPMQCARCGAHAASHGPVIPMVPAAPPSFPVDGTAVPPGRYWPSTSTDIYIGGAQGEERT